MPDPQKVLIAAPVHPVLLEALADHGFECVLHERITQSAAASLLADCVGVITSTRLLLNKSLIDAAPLLRWVGRMGSGMEIIDLPYAAEKGIVCFASPEGNCNAVGEHAMGMLLALIRRITWSHNELRHDTWKRDENRGIELEGKTVGIIGFGHTGAAFARKLSGFDVRIIGYDKYAPESVPANLREHGSLNEILAEADIISFHVPLQADTVHYFNEAFLHSMQRPFILINTSRGAVADMQAIHKGLATGKIRGACLDVFEQEPLSSMDKDQEALFHAIIEMPNVVATPHIAGYTYEALYKMSMTLAGKLGQYLAAQ